MKMVIKEIDEQGRIIIPQEWRKEGLGTKTKVQLMLDDGKVR